MYTVAINFVLHLQMKARGVLRNSVVKKPAVKAS
jgi:hypothetical protein